MKKVAYLMMAICLLFCFTGQVWAAENATTKEVISKCVDAAKLIKEKGIGEGIIAIGNKKGPFVWKDTYVFLMDLDGKMLAHPMKPELTQRDNLIQVKDVKGKPLFLEFVELANSKGSGWVEYMWPKPGDDKPAAKSSYIYRVPGTQYLVGAGIYK